MELQYSGKAIHRKTRVLLTQQMACWLRHARLENRWSASRTGKSLDLSFRRRLSFQVSCKAEIQSRNCITLFEKGLSVEGGFEKVESSPIDMSLGWRGL